MLKNLRKKSERGQVIIIIAFALVGLIAIVGLMVDGGILLIEYARLKRAIDSASIASALQFRRGFTGADLATAAEEFLILNQSDADQIYVWRCKDPGEVVMDDPTISSSDDGTFHDPSLCTVPLRKLLRIEATRFVTFGFLRIIGINGTTITASSVGEAASLDLVLVIDTSASMAYETTGSPDFAEPGDDPALCNSTQTCEPLESVKDVALQFMDTMFFPYDRVSIVTMTSQNADGFRDPFTLLELSDDEATVRAAISDIRVYQPPSCPSAYGTCRDLCTAAEIAAAASGTPCFGRTVGYFVGEDCPAYRTYGDRSSCTSSNVGGALTVAGAEFAREPIREDSFWVVIALIGGPANASTGTGDLTDDDGNGYPDDPYAFGFCPYNTWTSSVNPPCRDSLVSTRHAPGDVDGTGQSIYDADDFARDSADFLADPANGSGVTIFTIGLGDLVLSSPKSTPANSGELLLQYIAEDAGDSIGVTANHGFYAYSPDAAGLTEIFAAIAENIFTRLSQ